MVTIYIARWTALCGCIFELEWDRDLPQEEREMKFLLVNNVCPKHSKLKSKFKTAIHDNRSKHVIDCIEDIKNQNINNSQKSIRQAFLAIEDGVVTSQRHKELLANHELIEKRNDEITEEWNELVQRPWAFDSHIYDIVLKEAQEQQT